MGYLLGVDVGNTKTLYALANEDGAVINVHYGKPANFQSLGLAKSQERIKDGINETLSPLGIPPYDVGFVYYGVAGADRPKDFELIRKMLNGIEMNKFEFHNDGWIALKSGTIDGIGMVITCGTGNTNFACNSQREWKRIGGLDIL
ncbi:MAG: ATPase, partial [Thermotoga sp.]